MKNCDAVADLGHIFLQRSVDVERKQKCRPTSKNTKDKIKTANTRDPQQLDNLTRKTVLLVFRNNLSLSSSTFSNLPDKPWSRVSSLLPPGACLHFVAQRVQQSQ